MSKCTFVKELEEKLKQEDKFFKKSIPGVFLTHDQMDKIEFSCDELGFEGVQLYNGQNDDVVIIANSKTAMFLAKRMVSRELLA